MQDFQFVLTSTVDVFLVANTSKEQWGRDRNISTIMGMGTSVAHCGQPPFLHREN